MLFSVPVGHAVDRDAVHRLPRRRDHVRGVHRPLRLRLEAGLVRRLDAVRVLLARLQGRRLQSAARSQPAAVRGHAGSLRSGVRQRVRGRLEERARGRPRAGEPDRVLLPVRRACRCRRSSRARRSTRTWTRTSTAWKASSCSARSIDLLIDVNFAYLKTEIKDFSSIDPRDPSNGNPNWTMLKDIIERLELRATRPRQLATAQARRPACCRRRSADRSASAARWPATASPCRTAIAANLDGNSLQGTPEWSFKVGAQYTFASRQQHEPDGARGLLLARRVLRPHLQPADRQDRVVGRGQRAGRARRRAATAGICAATSTT